MIASEKIKDNCAASMSFLIPGATRKHKGRSDARWSDENEVAYGNPSDDEEQERIFAEESVIMERKKELSSPHHNLLSLSLRLMKTCVLQASYFVSNSPSKLLKEDQC